MQIPSVSRIDHAPEFLRGNRLSPLKDVSQAIDLVNPAPGHGQVQGDALVLDFGRIMLEAQLKSALNYDGIGSGL